MATYQYPSLVKAEEDRHNHNDYLTVLMNMSSLNTPFFLGVPNPFDANAWINRLKRNFVSVSCPLEFKRDIAVHFLDGNAMYWWEGAEHFRSINSWPEFEKEFNLQYMPLEEINRIKNQYLYLAQGSKSVREYELEFHRLRSFLQRDLDNENDVIRNFTRGLRPELQSRLAVVDFSRLGHLVVRAALIEEGLEKENNSMSPLFGSQKLGNECYNCGDIQHFARNCPNSSKKKLLPSSERVNLMPPRKRQA